MSPQALQTHVDLALRKQRLQLRAADQRAVALAQFERIERLLGLVDHARDVAQGVRQEAPLLAIAALLVAIARPRLAIRIARRAWVGWILYRKLGRGLAPLMQILRRFSP